MAYGLSENGTFECKHLTTSSGQIFAYSYGIANNVPAMVWDKPGSNYTGLGANGTDSEIQFGPCAKDSNGVWQWQSSPTQTWRFKGNVVVEGSLSASITATEVGESSMKMIPQYSDEVNFGGTGGTSIYFGHRDVGSRSKPTDYYFGGTAASASVHATGYYIGSSRKIKKRIKPTKINSLDLLNSVEVVDFFYKTDVKSENPKVGFIAEDTPEILTGKGHDSMDQANCIGVIIKAIQEISSRLNNIESKLGLEVS